MVLTTTLNHNSNIGSVHIIIQLYSQTQTQPLSSSYVNTNGQTVTLRNNNINPTTVKLQYPIYTAKRDETVLSHRVSWCKLGTGLTLTGVILPRWWFPAGADICGWQMSGDDDVDRYGIVHCLVRRRRGSGVPQAMPQVRLIACHMTSHVTLSDISSQRDRRHNCWTSKNNHTALTQPVDDSWRHENHVRFTPAASQRIVNK